MSTSPRFHGFGPEALPFLKALGFHQSREWFHGHKSIYDRQIKDPLGDLVDALSATLQEAGLPLRGDRKASLFRINRDVRFSKDKHPYNTHASAVLTRTGTKQGNGLLYVHVSPERSFTAAGFYQPATADLQSIRETIRDRPGGFLAMVKALSQNALSLSVDGALKRMPRGFEAEKDSDQAWALKLRSFVVVAPLDDASLGDPSLVRTITDFAMASRPLLDFGWRILG